jgi:hypothetical protein
MTTATILKGCYGPHVGAAGAVFPCDVLRCRCGRIQRALGRTSGPCLWCKDGTAFAWPATIGYQWREGVAIGKRPTRRPLLKACPTCSARPGAPCTSLGRLTVEGTVMGGFHAARRKG